MTIDEILQRAIVQPLIAETITNDEIRALFDDIVAERQRIEQRLDELRSQSIDCEIASPRRHQAHHPQRS